MRTVVVSLVVGLVVAGAAAVLAARREARRWFVSDDWDGDDIDWLREFEQGPYLRIQMPADPATSRSN